MGDLGRSDLRHAREWKGVWWVPDRDGVEEHKALPGTLTFDPDVGLTLDLHGAIPRRERSESCASDSPEADGVWPVVHGTVSGTPVTLLTCWPTLEGEVGIPPRAAEQRISAVWRWSGCTRTAPRS
jgi:hypothetical protein